MQTFFSHGKLLITGEYVVLDSALSLAVPTKLGQKMEVLFEENLADNTLTWYSIDSEGETWYREEFLLVEANFLFIPIQAKHKSSNFITFEV